MQFHVGSFFQNFIIIGRLKHLESSGVIVVREFSLLLIMTFIKNKIISVNPLMILCLYQINSFRDVQ